MIIEYHRPQTIDDALILLSRDQPVTVPLGGGTVLNQPSREAYAVVDLQSLGLDEINKHGQLLQIGATCHLQSLLELDGKSDVVLPQALCEAIRLEGTINIRQLATVAGGLVSADGRSPFGTAMLALNPTLTLLPGEEEISYGELLPLRDLNLRHRLIAQIYLPLHPGVRESYWVAMEKCLHWHLMVQSPVGQKLRRRTFFKMLVINGPAHNTAGKWQSC
jgi:CO/xanthine dehydrogenase FAD-binding subunit